MDLSAILLFAAVLAVAIATPGPTVAVLIAGSSPWGRRATSGLRSAWFWGTSCGWRQQCSASPPWLNRRTE